MKFITLKLFNKINLKETKEFGLNVDLYQTQCQLN